MVNKVLKIVLNIVASIVVFFIAAFTYAQIAQSIFGSTKGADGQEYANYNGWLFLVVVISITVVFAVWFYKFLEKKIKSAKK